MPSSRSRRRSRAGRPERDSPSDQKILPSTKIGPSLQRAFSGSNSGNQAFPRIASKNLVADLSNAEQHRPDALWPSNLRPESNRRSTYSSLPPTPISSSPPPPAVLPIRPDDYFTTNGHTDNVEGRVPFSLWDYLREEILATDFDSHQELKWDRVSNFLQIPLAVEKVCCLVDFGS